MKKRLLWIDLLKIISMVMVLILHICMKGGVLYSLEIGTAGYAAAWFIESLSYCAVNCYALITGYLMYRPETDNFRYFKIIPLWLQTFFYNAGITIMFLIISPDSLNEIGYSVIKGFTPVLSNSYWYFTSYFGMFFFIPFFNLLIKNLDKKQFTVLVLTLFILFSFVPYSFTEKTDIFFVNFGYSVLWLSTLYFGGAYIKRFGADIRIKKPVWAAVYFISSLIPCVNSVFLDVISASNMENTPSSFISGYTYDYTSPFTVAAGVSLFMLFRDIEVKNRFAEKLTEFFSPVSFSVFLMHTHPLVFESVFKNRFAFLAESSVPVMLLGILFFAVGLYIVLAAADHIRALLFKLIKVNENSERIVRFCADRIKNMKVR